MADTETRIGFVGVGRMGANMARRLKDQGCRIAAVQENVLGFVPFGFLVGLRLKITGRLSARRWLFLTMAAGFAASVVIEAAQTWLPGRDSSLLDLVANTVGMAIGGAMAGLFSWKMTTVLERIRLKRPAVFRRSIF